MKKIVALMRKEYLETRLLTLAFLGVVTLLSFVYQTRNGSESQYHEFNSLNRLVIGGFMAAWVNLVVLCGASFAREREKGTMTILRRITPDWRVAAVAKFGYAFVSTLAIEAFFALLTLAVDLFRGLALYTTLDAFASSFWGSPAYYKLILVADVLGLWFTPCWCAFWTNRVFRSFLAIFLAVLCSAVLGVLLFFVFSFYFKSLVYAIYGGFVCHALVGFTLLLLSARLCKRAYRVE